jgi:hypothetical protein
MQVWYQDRGLKQYCAMNIIGARRIRISTSSEEAPFTPDTNDSTRKGPGHHSFVRTPSTGEWRIFYHRWENQTGDGPYRGSASSALSGWNMTKTGSSAHCDDRQNGTGRAKTNRPLSDEQQCRCQGVAH